MPLLNPQGADGHVARVVPYGRSFFAGGAPRITG